MTTVPCSAAPQNGSSATSRFEALEAKSDYRSMQRRSPKRQKNGACRYRQSLVRPCHGFAALEAKSDDRSTQNPRVQKRARLPLDRALWSTPLPRFCGPQGGEGGGAGSAGGRAHLGGVAWGCGCVGGVGGGR